MPQTTPSSQDLKTLADALSNLDEAAANDLVEAVKRSNKTKAALATTSGHLVDPRIEGELTLAIKSSLECTHQPHVRLWGPKGAGKTSGLMALIPKIRGQVPVRMACTPFTGYSQLIGSVKQDSASGRWITELRPLVTAMIEGLPIILDEWNLLPPESQNILQGIMDDSPEVTLPIEGGDTLRITKAPGFAVFGTSNDNGDGFNAGKYVGSGPVNLAVLDRFGMTIRVDYLPADMERKVLIDRTGIGSNGAGLLVEIAANSRSQQSAAQGWDPISTRQLLVACERLMMAIRDPSMGTWPAVRVLEPVLVAGVAASYQAALKTAISNKLGNKTVVNLVQ